MDPRLALELEDEREDVEARLQKIQEEVESLLEEQEQLIKRREEINSRLEASAAAAAAWAAANNANANSEAAILCKRDVFVIMPAGGGKSLCYQLPALLSALLTFCPAALLQCLLIVLLSLRPSPHQIINAVLCKRDVFVIMPAGGGKSLCYQLPALLYPGISLVVSPLLSLIHDQVMCLSGFGVPAAMLTSTTSKDEERALGCRVKLLYVTPEKVARSKRFMSKLEKCHAAGRLSLIAIDCSCGNRTSLLYVTPEKVARSKRLMSKLEKRHAAGRLSLIAIDVSAGTQRRTAAASGGMTFVPDYAPPTHSLSPTPLFNPSSSLFPYQEAHCCSQWGHDFRPDYAHLSCQEGGGGGEKVPCPDYAHLSVLKKQFPKTPMLALTVSARPCSECLTFSVSVSKMEERGGGKGCLALTMLISTERVRDDVRDMLQMRRCELFVSSVNRPNLFYEVREKPPGAAAAVESIAHFILEHYAPSDSGIVYCFSRKECEQVASELSPRGSPAAHYRADMDPAHVHSEVASELSLRGIPAAHYHADMDPSHRTHVHESGRAGRDGLPARCILFFRCADLPRQPWRAGRDGLPPSLHSLLPMRRPAKTALASGQGWVAASLHSLLPMRRPAKTALASGQGWVAASLHSLLPMRRPAKTEQHVGGVSEGVLRDGLVLFTENAGLINLYAMGRYAMLSGVERTAIFRHFGEEPRECEGMCDICSQGGGGGERTAQQDFTPPRPFPYSNSSRNPIVQGEIPSHCCSLQSNGEQEAGEEEGEAEEWGRGNVKGGGKGESESWVRGEGITKETTEQLITHYAPVICAGE
ncbi:unnamed protein product [Closterium sp. Naga37s-1]|nr:unnamed protein product [Closterium sp. Naga37s-1]